ncbi:MAG: ATPase, T2SS/T4P/T4SS family [Thermodesulfobacteriota bacterium]
MEMRLGEYVMKKGLITRDQLREALLIQRGGDKSLSLKPGEKIGKILLAKGFMAPMTLVRVLCEQKENIDFLLIGEYLVEPRVITWLNEKIAVRLHLLPLVSMGDDMFIVASNRAIPEKKLEEFGRAIKRKVEVIVVSDRNLDAIIKKCYTTFKKRGISSVRIGEILVRDKYLTQQELNKALEESTKRQRMLGKVLIERGKVNEKDFFRILSVQRKMPLISAQDILPILDKGLIKNISKAFSLRNLIVPYLQEGDKVSAITAEPSINPDEFKRAMRCKKIELGLATYSDIELILRTIYADRDVEIIEESSVEGDDLEDLPIEDELAPVPIEEIGALTKRYQKVTSTLLLEAIKRRASDIHIEHYEKDICVRFRIDGTLYDIDYLPINKRNSGGVVNVIKVQSDLDIAERRLPQGGRFRKKTRDEGVYDFRVQTQPTLHGENIVIRVLNQSSPLLALNELGFSQDVLVRYEKLIQNPSGLILLTGPTGSGKTTTLYSTLGLLRKDLRKKIVTIEDPVEYSIERIQQAQVKEEIGYNFAQATRAFLREDPDIILIGEIRDFETAIEAMRASQTGHLVFSTLHTNNTIETVQRLIDIGINQSTIASELLTIISQRLAKRNCPDCRKEYKPAKGLLDAFYPYGVPSGLTFYKSGGCESCDFKGHSGRIAVYECWFLDIESKRLIVEKADFGELFNRALEQGMIPMIKDALMKVEAGLIPIDELPEIIPYFQIVNWREYHQHTFAAGPSLAISR